MRLLPFIFWFICWIYAQHAALAQDSLVVESSWTFDPPIPLGSSYALGTDVNICVSITYFSMNLSNWNSGFGIQLPEGWDLESLELLNSPEPCGNAESESWLPFYDLGCNGISFPPGFYFDTNAGGPQDGNPCNNYGNICPPFTGSWDFCFQVSVSEDFIPELLGQDMTPSIWIVGDGFLAGWGGPPPNNYYAIPPSSVFYVSGLCQEQGLVDELSICDTSEFDLNSLELPVSEENGDWYLIVSEVDSVLIENGLISAYSYPIGLYRFHYITSVNDTLDCSGSLDVFVEFALPTPEEAIDEEICGDPGLICPSDYLTIPSDEEATWYLFDSENSFIQQYSDPDFCIEAAELNDMLDSYEDGFSFIYFLGQFPCEAYTDTVRFIPNGPFGSDCSQILGISVSNECLPESAEIELYNSETGEWVQSYQSSYLEENTYYFEITESGIFDVYIDLEGSLNLMMTDQSLSDAIVIDFGPLVSGDFNGDNSIGIEDFSLFASAYGLNSGDEGFQDVLDIDCNGNIGIGDFSTFSSNYGLDGDDPE